jgi:hypothetical protein
VTTLTPLGHRRGNRISGTFAKSALRLALEHDTLSFLMLGRARVHCHLGFRRRSRRSVRQQLDYFGEYRPTPQRQWLVGLPTPSVRRRIPAHGDGDCLTASEDRRWFRPLRVRKRRTWHVRRGRSPRRERQSSMRQEPTRHSARGIRRFQQSHVRAERTQLAGIEVRGRGRQRPHARDIATLLTSRLALRGAQRGRATSRLPPIGST